MAKIIAVNDQFDGISATVQFNKGVGECADPYLISWFKAKGYEVIEDAAELEVSVPEPELEVEVEEELPIVEPEVEKKKTRRKNK